MQPENTTPEPIVNGTPSLAAQLQTPAKRKHTGVTLIVLSIIAFGIAAYAYFFMASHTQTVVEPTVTQTGGEQTSLSPEEEHQKWLEAELSRIEKEDGAQKTMTDEEREAELSRIEKEDGAQKTMTDEEREQMLQAIEYQDADAANQQQ